MNELDELLKSMCKPITLKPTYALYMIHQLTSLPDYHLDKCHSLGDGMFAIVTDKTDGQQYELTIKTIKNK